MIKDIMFTKNNPEKEDSNNNKGVKTNPVQPKTSERVSKKGKETWRTGGEKKSGLKNYRYSFKGNRNP
jgi:hypothetical protein